MTNVTRRDALFVGAGGLASLAGLLGLSACSSESTASSSGSAEQQATESKNGLAIDATTGLLARSEFIGLDEPVQLEDGSERPAINFDNGATTPSLVSALNEIQAQLPMYGSIGRGKGQKSAHSTQTFNAVREVVADFFGAPSDTYTVAFTGTATDALNKISSALCADGNTVVVTTRSEHHANDLPWRLHAQEVRYIEVDDKGRLRIDDLPDLLSDGMVDVVSVQAASNVTGYVHDVHAIARQAHEAGAIMVVDGAQIASHRAFSVKGSTPAEDIDFFVCSAHKMYAPFGGGCIVGKTEIMNSHVPSYRGGGMVDVVTDWDATWLETPDLWEAGSPNYFGQIALGKACEALSTVGFDAIQKHEQKLLRRAIDGLSAIDGVTLYADSESIEDRVGVLTFNIQDVKAADVAEEFANKYGIAVRQGEFCAHPLCHRLLGISDEEILADRDNPDFEAPAMVRVSMGMYNTEEDVDTLIEAVKQIAK